jgi:hypothetical protein
MFINNDKKTFDLHLKGDSKGLFHTIATITNKYKGIESREYTRS